MRIGARSIAAGLVVSLVATVARAEPSADRTARAVRAEGPLVVDGRLDEPSWARAPRIEDFIQRSPEYGEAPSQETSVRILFDDEALFVGFDCRDTEADRIVATLARRDQVPEADRVMVFLDGLHDGQSGFRFLVNAGGVLSDAALYRDTGSDGNWDGVWTADVSRDAGGWTAEMRIPFRILRYREGTSRTWGMQLRRVVARTREVIEWQPIPPGAATFVSSFGEIRGIEPPEAATPLEIRPYLAGRVGLGRAPDSLAPRDTLGGDLGVDAHWNPTPDLAVDATVNPDFGQVEVDPQVVNLGPYETYFGERRPFFLEGFEVFRTQFNLVHTRRIGAPPPTPEAPDDSDPIAEVPETTRIWGAAKVTGEIAPDTSVGVLSAFTGVSNAETESGDEVRAGDPALHQVVRLRRQFRGRSTVGVLATDVTRAFSDAPDSRANVGAADWDLRSDGGEWAVRGQVVGSRVDEPDEAPRNGWATRLWAGRVGGTAFRPDASLTFLGPDFDPNDLGFEYRDDLVSKSIGLSLVREEPWGPARSAWARVSTDQSRNTDGDLLGRNANLSGTIVFHSMWSTSLALALHAPHVDDLESRGGPDFPNPLGWGAQASFDTDFSRALFGGAGTWVGTQVDAPSVSQWGWVTARPTDAVELSLSASIARTFGYTRWVATEEDAVGVDHYVFATAEVTRADLVLRGLFVLTRTLTFQLYAQAIRAIGDHSDHRELLDDETLVPYGPENENDFDTTGVSLQSVVRWEIWPGNTLFVVYRHQLMTNAVPSSGSLADGRDPFLDHLLDRGDDAILAKLTLLWWP